MSLRSVDLQVMVPKMTEIAGSQGSESARQLQAAQHAADGMKATVDAELREVHTKKAAQEVKLRADRERDERGRGRRRDKHRGGGERDEGKTNAADADGSHGSFIDVKL